MSRPPRITRLDHLGELTIRLTFDDGLTRDLDLEPMLQGGILDELREPRQFAQARLDETAGTVSWPNGVDLDPDVLHGGEVPATGRGPRVLSEVRLRSAG